MKDISYLIQDATFEGTLRNLSVSPKKLTSLLSELTELCESSNAKEAIQHLVDEASAIIRVELQPNPSVHLFDDADSKRIKPFIAKFGTTPVATEKSSIRVNPKLFQRLLTNLSRNDNEQMLVNSLNNLSLINPKTGGKSKKGGAKPKVVYDPPLNLSVDLMNLIRYYQHESSDLRTCLILLKLLLLYQQDEQSSKWDLSELEQSPDVLTDLSTSFIPDERDLTTISSNEKYHEHLRTFELVPRVILSTGQPSKLSSYEVQGRATGFVSGISINAPDSGIYYFETTLKGRSFIGVRMGWGWCGASLNGKFGLPGATDECWAFEPYSQHLYHNALERSKEYMEAEEKWRKMQLSDEKESTRIDTTSTITTGTTTITSASSKDSTPTKTVIPTTPSQAEIDAENYLLNMLKSFNLIPPSIVKQDDNAPLMSFGLTIDFENSLFDSENERNIKSFLNWLLSDDPTEVDLIRTAMIEHGLSIAHLEDYLADNSDLYTSGTKPDFGPVDKDSVYYLRCGIGRGREPSTSASTATAAASAVVTATREESARSSGRMAFNLLRELVGKLGDKKADGKLESIANAVSASAAEKEPETKEERSKIAKSEGGVELLNNDVQLSSEVVEKLSDFKVAVSTVVGCAFDSRTGEMSFYLNGMYAGKASSTVPIGTDSLFQTRGLCPVFCSGFSSGLEVNVGQAPYQHFNKLIASSDSTASKKIETKATASASVQKAGSLSTVSSSKVDSNTNDKVSTESSTNKTNYVHADITVLRATKHSFVTLEKYNYDLASPVVDIANADSASDVVSPTKSDIKENSTTSEVTKIISEVPAEVLPPKRNETIFIDSIASEGLKAITIETSVRFRFDQNTHTMRIVPQNTVASQASRAYTIITCGSLHGNNSSDETGCSLGVDQNGAVFFELLGGERVVAAADIIEFDKWYHLSATYNYHRSNNKATVVLFINGVSVHSQDILGNKKVKVCKICPRTVTLGDGLAGKIDPSKHYQPPTSTVKCDICQVVLWTNARTSDRILASLGRAKASGVELELLLFLPFEELCGNTIHDSCITKNIVRSTDHIIVSAPPKWGFFPQREKASAANHLTIDQERTLSGSSEAVLKLIEGFTMLNFRANNDESHAKLVEVLNTDKDESNPDSAETLANGKLSKRREHINAVLVAVCKRLIVSCDKFESAEVSKYPVEFTTGGCSIARKFQYESGAIKSLIEPSMVNFLLISSILRELMCNINKNSDSKFGDAASNPTAMVALCLTLLRVLKANLVAVQELNSPMFTAVNSLLPTLTEDAQKLIASKLCVNLLYLSSLENDTLRKFSEAVHFTRKEFDARVIDSEPATPMNELNVSGTLDASELTSTNSNDVTLVFQDETASPSQRDVVNLLAMESVLAFTAGVDFLVPAASNQLFILECLMLRRFQNIYAVIGSNVYADVLSLLSNNPRLDNNTDNLSNDPLIALLSISDAADVMLFDALSRHLSRPNSIAKLIPYELWPVCKVDASSSSGLFSNSNTLKSYADDKIVPKSGDFVKRGPDWKYDNQDGGVESMGIVVEVVDWLSEHGKGLSVRWTNGHVNTYRWGTYEPNPANPKQDAHKFDVCIQRSPCHVLETVAVTGKSDLKGSDAVEETTGKSKTDGDSKNESKGRNSSKAGKSKSEDTYPRKVLSYSPDDVNKALIENKGTGSLTKRSILQYIIDNSTAEWQNKMKLLRSVNSLLLKYNAPEIAELYNDFYQAFSLSISKSGGGSGASASKISPSLQIEPRHRSGHASVAESGNDLFIERLANCLSMFIKHFNDRQSKHTLRREATGTSGNFLLIQSMQACLVGALGSSAGSNYSGIRVRYAGRDKALITKSFAASDGTRMVWNWSEGVWSTEAIERTASKREEDKLLNAKSTPREENAGHQRFSPSAGFAGVMQRTFTKPPLASTTNVSALPKPPKILTDFSIDKNYVGSNLHIKTRTRAIEIIQSTDREWNTCICSTPLSPNTGVYKWYVRIKNFSERRGHCMLGVATGDFNFDEFLGQDQESWGLSPSLDLFHGGRKKRTDSGRKLCAGSLIELTLDTDNGTLFFVEMSPETVKVTEPIGFDNLKGVTVFPAFSLYSPGDCILIQTYLEEIQSITRIHDLLTNSAAKTASSTTTKASSSNEASVEKAYLEKAKCILLGAPNFTIINYCLQLIASVCSSLSSANVQDYNTPILNCLNHMLARLNKWQLVSSFKMRLLHTELCSLVQKASVAVSRTREHLSALPEKSLDDSCLQTPSGLQRALTTSTDDDALDKSALQLTETCIVQLIVLSSAYLNKISRTLILAEYPDINNLTLLKEEMSVGAMVSMIDTFKYDQQTGKALAPPNQANKTFSPKEWLQGTLFQNGSRSQPLIDIFTTIVNNQTLGARLFASWMSQHDKTHKNFARIGGDTLNSSVHLFFVVNVYHAGYAALLCLLYELFCGWIAPKVEIDLNAINALLDNTHDELLISVAPPSFLCHVWASAMKLRIWAKEVNNSGVSYEYLADHLSNRCKFLLELEPSVSSKFFHRGDVTLEMFLHSVGHDSRSQLYSSSELNDILSSTKSFVVDSCSIVHIHALLQSSFIRAEMKRDGFRTLRTALQHFNNDVGYGAKIALLSSLSYVIRGGQSLLSIRRMLPSSIMNSFAQSMNLDGDSVAYYMDGLIGVSKTQRSEVQTAFDALFMALVGELSSCDCKTYLLTLLSCLGVRILEHDHAMLSRVNFFHAIQELVDNSLSEIVDNRVELERNLTPGTNSTPSKSIAKVVETVARSSSDPNKLVIKAAMKLFIFVAFQVAMSRDLTTAAVPNQLDSPLQLRRIESGPATLSKAVFDILYLQLSDTTDLVLNMSKNSVSKDYFIPTVIVSPSVQLISSEAIILLLCVSTNETCRQMLTKPKWVLLLLRLARLNQSGIQSKAILLLGDILPYLNLASWKPGDSDECNKLMSWVKGEIKNGDDTSSAEDETWRLPLPLEQQDWLQSSITQLLIETIGNLLLKLDASTLICCEGTDVVKNVTELAYPVIAEIVALVRMLSLSPQWTSVVESVLVANIEAAMKFSSVPDICQSIVAFPSLLAVLFVMGGQLDAAYLNSPVIFQSTASKDFMVGVISDLNDSSDKVQVSYYPIDTDVQAGAHPLSLSVSMDKILPINRCPTEKFKISRRMIEVVLSFLIQFVYNDKSESSTVALSKNSSSTLAEDKTETDTKEEKLSKDDSAKKALKVRPIMSNLDALLETSCYRLLSTVANGKSTVDALLSVMLDTPSAASAYHKLLQSLLRESQLANKSAGLADVPIYEEYVMIVLRQRQKLWANDCQAAYHEKIRKTKTANKVATTTTASDKSATKVDSSAQAKGEKTDETPITSEQTDGATYITPPTNSVWIDSKRTNAWGEADSNVGIWGDQWEPTDAQSASSDAGQAAIGTGAHSTIQADLIETLQNMGFPARWCEIALEVSGWDPEEALNYILMNSYNLVEMDAIAESSNAATASSSGATVNLSTATTTQPASGIVTSTVDSKAAEDSEPAPSDIKATPLTATGNTNDEAEEMFAQGIAYVDPDFSDVLHYPGVGRKLLPFYASPTFDSERVGCIFPCDDVSILDKQPDPADPSNTWYKIQYADFDDGNFQSANPDDILDIYVWVPKFYKGVEVLLPGSFQGMTEDALASPPGDSLQISRTYRVVGKNGALVRQDVEIESNEVTSLATGTVVHAVEETYNNDGTLRLRINDPIDGWISKIFGLVEKVKDNTSTLNATSSATSTNASTVGLLSNRPETQTSDSLNEMELLERIDDNMEHLTALDAYNKEDRFFGSMQGNQYIKYRDRERTRTNSVFNRRIRVSGANSFLSYLNGNSSGAASKSVDGMDGQISQMLSTLKKLYSRKITLAIFLKSLKFRCEKQTVDGKDELKIAFDGKACPRVFEFIFNELEKTTTKATSENTTEVDNNDETIQIQVTCHAVVKQVHNFLRMIVFRGEPYSYTGLEMLPFDELVSLANSSRQVSIEQLMDQVIWSILGSSDALRDDSLVGSAQSSMRLVQIGDFFRITLVGILIESIAKNIRLSCASKYADHFWADSSYEEDLDDDLLEQPNLHYAVWMSRILIAVDNCDILFRVFRCWLTGLRGSSLSLKHVVFNCLTEILSFIRLKIGFDGAELNEKESSKRKRYIDLLNSCLSMLPLERLRLLATKRLWYEMEDNPSYSRVMQALLNFLSDIDISTDFVNQLNEKATSTDTCLEDKIASPTESTSPERPVLRFGPSKSYVHLTPQKDLPPNWTVEFWLFRHSEVKEPSKQDESASNSPSFDVTNEAALKTGRSVNSASGGSKSISSGTSTQVNDFGILAGTTRIGQFEYLADSDDSRGLSGLLNMLLGSNKKLMRSDSTKKIDVGGQERSEELQPAAAAASAADEPTKDTKRTVKPMMLLSSSKCHIKLQVGGRLFSEEEEFADPNQTSDPVNDESLCVSVGQTGGTEKVFDCIIPSDKWVHVAFVCQSTPSSSMSLYLNGELQDVLYFHMNLPIGSIGSSQPDLSFVGDMAEFRIWSVAKTRAELRRDMLTTVTGTKKLVAYIPMDEGFGSAVQDKSGVLNACKMFNCEWVRSTTAPLSSDFEVPLFMLRETESAEGFYGEEIGSSARVVEMTGIMKMNPVQGAQGGELSHAVSEVITLSYRYLLNPSTQGEIEGYLHFSERGVRLRLRGMLKSDRYMKIWTVTDDAIVLGPPESVDWIHSLVIEGTISENALTGALVARCFVNGTVAMGPGETRIDRTLLPPEVKYSEESSEMKISSNSLFAAPRRVNEVVSVAKSIKEGQFVVSVELTPYELEPAKVTTVNNKPPVAPTASSDVVEGTIVEHANAIVHRINTEKELDNLGAYLPFGICNDEGAIWLRWKIRASAGCIGFGIYAEDALVHPDASVDANEGTWSYSSSGQASHGADLFLCDSAEDGDFVDLHLNTDVGYIAFYKNNKMLIEFESIKTHPNFINDEHATVPLSRRGFRPFVSLTSASDSVVFMGLREGPCVVEYTDEDTQNRFKAIGCINRGALNGIGVLVYNCDDDHQYWCGAFEKGLQTGIHVLIGVDQLLNAEETSEITVLKARRYIINGNISKFEDLIDSDVERIGDYDTICTTIKTDLLELRSKLKENSILINGEVLVVDAPPRLVSMDDHSLGNLFALDPPSADASTTPAEALVASQPVPVPTVSPEAESKLSVRVKDSSKDDSLFKVTSSMQLKKLFDAYAMKKGVTSKSFVFTCDTRKLKSDGTFSSSGIVDGSVIEAKVNSLNGASAEEVERYVEESTAPYVLRVIYETGATVRNGVEIEDSAFIRTLNFDDVLEAFRKSSTTENIGRFQIADGWISEKLRGGTEASVVQILRENFPTPLSYKVVREEGAKIRSGPSLSTSDRGFCPMGTVLKVSEKRYIKVMNESEPTIRVRISSPVEWQGWASEKEHILTLLDDGTSTGLTDKNGKAIDPAHQTELKRRATVRSQRKSKKEFVKCGTSSGSTSKKQRLLVSTRGTISTSEETFFLLRKSKSSGHANISPDFTTITCDKTGSGRSMAYGSRGFSKGVHYWEVQVNAANWGSVFIGVAPEESSGWNGYGILNYRATQAYGSETLYGSYFSVGDKVGVLLDMDHGTISFFKDGEDFNIGRVRVINMGVAYHNLRRGNSRSSNTTLFPIFGVKSSGDQLAILNNHWSSYSGLSAKELLSRILESKKIIYLWNIAYKSSSKLPTSLIWSMFEGYRKWRNKDKIKIISRPGVEVTIDTSFEAIEKAAGEYASKFQLRMGKKVKTQYGEGKILGARRNQLWYSYDTAEDCNWYWKRNQLDDLIGVGFINFDVPDDTPPVSDAALLRSLSHDQGHNSVGDKIKLRKTPSLVVEVLTYEEFESGLTDVTWTLDEDSVICQVVNDLTHKFDVDPLRITASDLEKYIVNERLLPGKTSLQIQSRYAALCVLNKAAAVASPWVDFNSGDNRSCMVNTSLARFDTSAYSCTTSPKSLSGSSLLEVKRAIFTRTKMATWKLAIKESTTPTAAPADEYERPDDLREITINRVEARNLERANTNMSFAEKLKVSVFGQLMDNMLTWDDRSLRRAFVHMQDAGQARAFFVKFTGEGVDDQGGPYRAVFQTSVGEEAPGLLGLFQPCANNRMQIGDNRDKYVFNSSLTSNISYANVFVHLGKLIALAARHHVMVPLSLSKLFWKPLSGQAVTLADLHAIDASVTSSLKAVISSDMLSETTESMLLGDTMMNSNEQISDLLVQALTDCSTFLQPSAAISNGLAKGFVDAALEINTDKLQLPETKELSSQAELQKQKLEIIIELVQHLHLISQSEGLKYMYKGMSSIIPVEIFHFFTPEELEGIFCGEAEVDIDTLKKATVYESVSPNDSHIVYFWDALEELSNEERSQFVNFCSGRSRLPAAASDFPMNFKLTGPPSHSEAKPDNYLPIARTCFFTLSLPKYSSQEVCLKKLKYAIRNTELMDADFIDRRGTTGWENVR